MGITDASKLDENVTLTTDVCIVGAGAAGITIANELDGSPLDVCLIESGGLGPNEDTQSLCDLENTGYPIRENFMSRARYFGGTCNLWAGRTMKLGEIDLARRDWVSHSGWPISYAELDRHYAKACEILRLPSPDTFEARAHKERMTERELGLFENSSLAPTVSLWAARPLRFGAMYRNRLRRSRNITLFLNANVIRINLTDSGRAVESVTVRGFNLKTMEVKARFFILACGGLENARLLLASHDRHAQGVGNRFDVVGRYYMDHPRAVFGEIQLSEAGRLRLLRGFPLSAGRVQVGIGIAEEVQRRESLLNHYLSLEAPASQYTQQSYQSFVQTMKIVLRRGYAGSRWKGLRARRPEIPEMIYLLTPKELMPHFLYRSYATIKDKVNLRGGEQRFTVVNFCEQAPDPESRVVLSHQRDRLGVNTLALNWRIGPEVTRSMMRLQELVAEHLQKLGIGTVSSNGSDLSFTDASHHIGTTRMSKDPRSGVVDADCKVHEVDNLFIAGSSVFPTAGHANPTLTIVALAVRLAQHVQKSLVSFA